MLDLLPLLVADPALPFDLRASLTRSPEEGRKALIRLGLGECDASELVGLAPRKPCQPAA